MAQDKRSLVELLMHHAESDSDFRDRLVLAMAQRGGKTANLASFCAAIGRAPVERAGTEANEIRDDLRR
jgi:hypothetical protein